jgi:dihydrofolate reductase
MRRVLYSVAMSLDGYIAGPDGGYDWIPEEPEIDWARFLSRFDTVLMGRGTWEVLEAEGGAGPTAGMRRIVFSTRLDPAAHPEIEVVGEDAAGVVSELKAEQGKDIWLMGGGQLFRSLLEAGVVDGVEAAVVPVLLGGGIPFLPADAGRVRLESRGVETYPTTGLVLLSYDVA